MSSVQIEEKSYEMPPRGAATEVSRAISGFQIRAAGPPVRIFEYLVGTIPRHSSFRSRRVGSVLVFARGGLPQLFNAYAAIRLRCFAFPKEYSNQDPPIGPCESLLPPEANPEGLTHPGRPFLDNAGTLAGKSVLRAASPRREIVRRLWLVLAWVGNLFSIAAERTNTIDNSTKFEVVMSSQNCSGWRANTVVLDLHTSGITAMRAYFDQAEKTTTMLAKCTAEPLPFSERLIIASQEMVENSAHADYLGIKRRLHDAARLSYEEDR